MMRVRLDKWLWAARFFKTRALAAQAVFGGKVHVNGARAKPGRALHVDDWLDIVRGSERWRVKVLALALTRGPAAQAQRLYDETAQSRLERARGAELSKLVAPAVLAPRRRPNKKDRRLIHRFKRDFHG